MSSSFHPLGCRCVACNTPAAQETDTVLIPRTQTLRDVLRRTQRSSNSKGSFSGIKPIRAKLHGNPSTASSAAATALSGAIAVQCTTAFFPELASFETVYDEARVRGIKIHWYPTVSPNGGAGAYWSSLAVGCEFDTLIAAPGALPQCMEASHSVGPFIVQNTVNGTGSGASPSFAKYQCLSVKPPTPLAVLETTDSMGGAWFTVDAVANSLNLFVHTFFATALSGTGIVTLHYMYELDMEFRMRT